MQSARPNPRPPLSRTDVYVRDESTGTTFRVNPPGTYAGTGGLDGSTLVIQLVRRGHSDLVAVDLSSRTLRPYPAWINTPEWEWRPTLSGRWLLFGRIDFATNTYAVVLADLRARTSRVLASVSGHAAYAAPGQVNGSYAVWTSCPDNWCQVYRYDIRRHALTRMPNADYYASKQFGASVTRTGTTYFGTAGRGCVDVRLVRFDRGRVSTLLRFPPGTAFQYSFADDRRAAGTEILYDRVGCRRQDLSDIYRVTDRAP